MIHGFYAIVWSLQLTSARFITTRQQFFPSWVVEELPVIRELPDNFYFPQANLLITPNLPLRQRKLYGHLTPRTVSVQETICSPGWPQ